MRVLVLEDNPFNAVDIQRLLKGAHEPVVVCSTETALAEMAGEKPVDVIICDMDMPVADYMEAIACLNRAAPAIPVIALVDQDREDLIEQIETSRMAMPVGKSSIVPAMEKILSEAHTADANASDDVAGTDPSPKAEIAEPVVAEDNSAANILDFPERQNPPHAVRFEALLDRVMHLYQRICFAINGGAGPIRRLVGFVAMLRNQGSK